MISHRFLKQTLVDVIASLVLVSQDCFAISRLVSRLELDNSQGCLGLAETLLWLLLLASRQKRPDIVGPDPCGSFFFFPDWACVYGAIGLIYLTVISDQNEPKAAPPQKDKK